MLRNKGVVVFNKQPMSRVGKRWCSRGTTRYGYLYWFPESAVTDYHELGGFKENAVSVFCFLFFFLQFRLWFFQWSCMDVRVGL